MRHLSSCARTTVRAIAVLGLILQARSAGATTQLTLPIFTNPYLASGLNTQGTIGFAFAGNKFVGSVENSGTNSLYSCNLQGGNVQLFAPTVSLPSFLPGGVEEHYVTSCLGLGTWTAYFRDIFVTCKSEGSIWHINNAGTSGSKFCWFPANEQPRGILFDPTGNFGYDMLVTTNSGKIYRVQSNGGAVTTPFASLNTDTEGMDIPDAGTGFGFNGIYDGQLIVASENPGRLHAISPAGVVSNLYTDPTHEISIPGAEELTFVPMNLGTGGAGEGYYCSDFNTANQANSDVLWANWQQFDTPMAPVTYRGDLLVTGENSGTIWRVHHIPNSLYFDVTSIGNLPAGHFSEDGLFVRREITILGACCHDGQCKIMSSDLCTEISGTYYGDNSSCLGVVCPPWGACCFPNGSCGSVSPDSCVKAGGVYRGNSSVCVPDSCPHCTEEPCFIPASCLQSWYPFDDPLATPNLPSAADVTAGSTLTWRNGQQWADTGPCNRPWCADLYNDPPHVHYLEASSGNLAQDNFDQGSFSIFAWVNFPALTTNNSIHTLVDKRFWDVPGSLLTGYMLYIYNGTLRMQLGSLSTWTTYVGPTLTPGWHLVGASVSRIATPPLYAFGASLWVDCNSVSFDYTHAVNGSLNNAAPLRIGEQSSGFSTGTPFGGYIDELQIYKCALDASQVCDLYNRKCDYCRFQCYVPSIVSSTTFDYSTPTSIRIWNFDSVQHTFRWWIAGLANCGTKSPTVFTPPSSGTKLVTVGPLGGYADVNNILISYPPNFLTTDTGCYKVIIQDVATGRCTECTGKLGRTVWHIDRDPRPPGSNFPPVTVRPAPQGEAIPLTFRLQNDSTVPRTIGYELLSHSCDGDSTSGIVSLNGLPPGTPVTGQATLAPWEATDVQVQAVLTDFQPLNINEVVFAADWNGGQSYAPAAAIGLQSMTDDQVAGVPEPPPAIVSPKNGVLVSATPNPFTERTEIRFSLMMPNAAVRVGVFDVAGRVVREIFSGPLETGVHQYAWDGLNANGEKSGSGIYFIRVQAPGVMLRTKLVRME
jgi:hypothetical protein